MSNFNHQTTIGIDFGTSNSAVAFRRGDEVHLAKFDRAAIDALYETSSPSASTAPTLQFYAKRGTGVALGHNAIAAYLEAGLDGRFIQSIKAFLPSKTFKGTHIRGVMVTIEQLVARYIRWLVGVAKETLGFDDVDRIVVGRPARFSADDTLDAIAQARLTSAVDLAGFGQFELMIEPVAAALSFEAELDRDCVVLVADLGGGTSDFTVMRVGPGERGNEDRQQSILAAGGVAIAGDRIDGAIVRAALLPALGYRTAYSVMGDETTIPNAIFHRLLRWNHVSFLKGRDTIEFLRRVTQTAEAPDAIRALLRIVEDDMGYVMFKAVERAKIAMASADSTWIKDDELGLPVSVELERQLYRDAIAPLLDEIMAKAHEVADASGAPIDAVFMTGGTSLLPDVRARFADAFGDEKIQSRDNFTSVAAGLVRGGKTSALRS